MISLELEKRFGGVARLYGRSGLDRLLRAHVCVVGVGGVGSWTVEALARSGVGAITMIDLDEVCITNVNRQLPAMEGTVGRAKVEVLAERIAAIHPECAVRAEQEFFTASTADRFLAGSYSWVIDAIDVPRNKCLLIASCRDRGIPVLTVGGAGGRRDATAVRVEDLGRSGHDALLRVVRRGLRSDYGFPKEHGAAFGVPCVYSQESPFFPWADGSVCSRKEEGSSLALDCSSGFGAATFVTGVFGFAAAGEVVRRIALESGEEARL
jgi:tRNA A37 threonylcarbamoyladenosine dehydratase